jgi:hypothetical protein
MSCKRPTFDFRKARSNLVSTVIRRRHAACLIDSFGLSLTSFVNEEVSAHEAGNIPNFWALSKMPKVLSTNGTTRYCDRCDRPPRKGACWLARLKQITESEIRQLARRLGDRIAPILL